MRTLVVVKVTDRPTDQRGVFPSWSSIVAFYRAKPKALVATVTIATLPNLLWVIDRLT